MIDLDLVIIYLKILTMKVYFQNLVLGIYLICSLVMGLEVVLAVPGGGRKEDQILVLYQKLISRNQHSV